MTNHKYEFKKVSFEFCRICKENCRDGVSCVIDESMNNTINEYIQ